ncbi:MAG: T9SS type A sorting domain-containing protein, partial [Bacteroidales bacterium]|nr:T9SS type A sorting domain-containing protein [Bacteroidales bacterium]
CGNESSYSNEESIFTLFNHHPVLYQRIFFIEPNLAKGTIIDTLWSRDEDRDQNLSYYLASNNTCDAFALDPITGEITVEDPQQVAYPGSSNDTLRLWVAVRDDFDPPAADSTEILIILKLNTSLPEIKGREEFVLDLYPNPATSKVSVNFGDHGSIKEGKLQLINANGQVLYVKDYHVGLPPTQVIPLDHLPGGIYSVLFNTSERQCVGKLVIMR